ncbi:hypothetical protein VTK56DRAFT_4981 [Thermocarpiscus australiensis]
MQTSAPPSTASTPVAPFPGTGFTKAHPSTLLPSPASIRARNKATGHPDANDPNGPPLVRIPELGLLVKYGYFVTLAEVEGQRYVYQHLQSRVPVPEVMGWAEDAGQGFIYMALINAPTLAARWNSQTEPEETALCKELKAMVEAWRGLKQNPEDIYTGAVDRLPLNDIIVRDRSRLYGPWLGKDAVQAFHNACDIEISGQIPIVFTHGDLVACNILVTDGSNPRVAAVIDWAQAGWYPSYWEWCKAKWVDMASNLGMDDAAQEQWRQRYLPLIIDPLPDSTNGLVGSWMIAGDLLNAAWLLADNPQVGYDLMYASGDIVFELKQTITSMKITIDEQDRRISKLEMKIRSMKMNKDGDRPKATAAMSSPAMDSYMNRGPNAAVFSVKNRMAFKNNSAILSRGYDKQAESAGDCTRVSDDRLYEVVLSEDREDGAHHRRDDGYETYMRIVDDLYHRVNERRDKDEVPEGTPQTWLDLRKKHGRQRVHRHREPGDRGEDGLGGDATPDVEHGQRYTPARGGRHANGPTFAIPAGPRIDITPSEIESAARGMLDILTGRERGSTRLRMLWAHRIPNGLRVTPTRAALAAHPPVDCSSCLIRKLSLQFGTQPTCRANHLSTLRSSRYFACRSM